MESRSIWLVLLGVTIASFANGQDSKQSQSVILPSAARPGVSAALGRDIQRYGVRSRDVCDCGPGECEISVVRSTQASLNGQSIARALGECGRDLVWAKRKIQCSGESSGKQWHHRACECP